MLVVSEHNRADRVLLKIKRKTECIVWKLQHFTLHGVCQAMNARNAVCQTHHGAFCASFGTGIKILDPFLNQFTDFGGV